MRTPDKLISATGAQLQENFTLCHVDEPDNREDRLFTLIAGSRIGPHFSAKTLRKQRAHGEVSKRVRDLVRSTSEAKPRFVEIIARAIRSGQPNHHRCRIGHCLERASLPRSRSSAPFRSVISSSLVAKMYAEEDRANWHQ
jgi:hypothetical protein